MKFSLIVSCLAALVSSSTTAAEHLRRNLQVSGGGSFNVCFSEKATVQVHGKGSVTMKDLAVGDQVLTPSGRYEPVYAFAHWDDSTDTEFLSIASANININGQAEEEPLEISESHMIYVHGKAHPVRADSLEVGTVLPQGSVITRIETVKRTGLYAPLTPSGSLLVNGIKASSYVSIQEGSTSEYWLLQDGVSSGISNQDLFHLFLSPFRMICMGISSDLCQSNTPNGIPHYAEYSLSFAHWFQSLPLLMQSIVLVTIVVVFGCFLMLEAVVGPTYAPLVVFTLTIAFAMNYAFQTMRSSNGTSRVSKERDSEWSFGNSKAFIQRTFSTW